METLETRALLAASISVSPLNSEAATHNVTVTYTDAEGINASTIDSADVSVSGGSGPVGVALVGTSGEGGEIIATYALTGPGGSWDAADNGEYSINVAASAVQDSADNNLDAGDTASLIVNVQAPDTAPPTADISVAPVTSAGATSHTVTIVYSDPSGVTAGSIDVSDVIVARVGANGGTGTGGGGGAGTGGGGGTGGVLAVTNVDVSGSGNSVTAVYTFTARGGSWDSDDNGIYSVSLNANAVQDAATPNANGNAAGNATFNVDIPVPPPPPGDTIAPTASIAVANVTTGAPAHTVVVTYTDETAIDATTIGIDDLQISQAGSATPLQLTNVTPQVSADGKTVTATYLVIGPLGSFDSADNGSYNVSLAAGSVLDTSGNAATATPATLTVDVPPLIADALPVAVISAPNITAPGGTTQTVTVVYSDDGRVRTSSIGTNDIVVSNGASTLTVTDLTATATDGGRTVTAVYTLAAPGGTWDTPDNGTYTVTLADSAVTDSRGNGVAATTGSFAVDATVLDTASPTVSLAAANVTTEGVTSQVVTVTYADDVGIDLSTIGVDDLTVTGPGGALSVNVINVSTSADGKTATVGYTFGAPDGLFSAQSSGSYAIAVSAGAVLDTAGKPITGASGAFQVAVPLPPPIDDTFGSGNAVVTTFTAEAIAVDATGRLIVVGRGTSGAVIERRLADGTLDTTFNATGQAVSTADTAYYALVVQGDKVVVAGNAGGDLVLARYNADGKLDTTFGTAGRAVVDFGQPNDVALTLAVTSTGQLIAAGQTNGDFALARFSADGVLDTTFGGNGTGFRAVQVLGNDLASQLLVQSDGKILVAGTTNAGVAVARFLADGTPDTSFSGDGVRLVPNLVAVEGDIDTADRSIALALDADGNILVGNRTADGNFGIVRIIPGTTNIDASFGTAGLASIDFGGDDDADQIFVQPTGEIIVLGTSASGATGSVTVAALDTDGNLITAFGTGGKLVLELPPPQPGDNTARELHLGDLVLRAFGTRQSDGRIVLGNSTQTSQQSTSELRRVNAPGVVTQAMGQLIGNFGVVNGRSQRLPYVDSDGTAITFAIKGGTGSAFLGADGKINLVLTEDATARGAGVTVAIKARGGNGRVALGDVTVNGSLKSLSLKTGDLSGTFFTTGSINKLTLGNVNSGAAIAAAGNMKSVTLASLTDAKVLAGTNLGNNGEFGGIGPAADSYSAANIGKLKVAGQIVNSTVGAGLDPVDATFLDDDDKVIGGAAASFIKSLQAAGADQSSRFVAAGFGKAKLGAKVTPALDQRFRLLQ